MHIWRVPWWAQSRSRIYRDSAKGARRSERRPSVGTNPGSDAGGGAAIRHCAVQQPLKARHVSQSRKLRVIQQEATLAIASASKKLSMMASVGCNPGSLKSATYIPPSFPHCRPLVVVLHGSMQTAEDFNYGSGWSTLADQHCFALLFPQQRRSNNAIRAFNWFEQDDSHRGGGEALSILEMIEQVVLDHAIDRHRIFITGLSSGGAMTSVMLATYPDVFAGGAIIAGLPYAGASSLMQALNRMKGYDGPSDKQLDALVRAASRNFDDWPTISVWHGSDDRTVDPSNADAIVRQWQALHGAEEAPTRTDIVDGYPRRVWCDSGGGEVIEEYRIPNMGHGAPLQTEGANGYGASGDYMLDVGICSTKHIVSFWGLSDRKDRTKKNYT
jgi:poly(hydroxyalkanoate) depolymerase family esterase